MLIEIAYYSMPLHRTIINKSYDISDNEKAPIIMNWLVLFFTNTDEEQKKKKTHVKVVQASFKY